MSEISIKILDNEYGISYSCDDTFENDICSVKLFPEPGCLWPRLVLS